MGRISQFVCPECRQAWKINLGHGLRHAVLDKVLNEFSQEMREKILARIGGQQIFDFDFNYRAAVCGHCGEVVAVPVLGLRGMGEPFVGECPACGHAPEIGGETLACPHCGAARLEEQTVGMWD